MCFGDTTKQFSAPPSRPGDFSLGTATSLLADTKTGASAAANPGINMHVNMGLRWDLGFGDSSLLPRDFSGLDWNKLPDPLGLFGDSCASSADDLASVTYSLFPEIGGLDFFQQNAALPEECDEEKSPLSSSQQPLDVSESRTASNESGSACTATPLRSANRSIRPAESTNIFDPHAAFASPLDGGCAAVYARARNTPKAARPRLADCVVRVAPKAAEECGVGKNSKTKEASRRSRLKLDLYRGSGALGKGPEREA